MAALDGPDFLDDSRWGMVGEGAATAKGPRIYSVFELAHLIRSTLLSGPRRKNVPHSTSLPRNKGPTAGRAVLRGAAQSDLYWWRDRMSHPRTLRPHIFAKCSRGRA